MVLDNTKDNIPAFIHPQSTIDEDVSHSSTNSPRDSAPNCSSPGQETSGIFISDIHDNDIMISLPWLLQVLFGLNGLTLSLQSLSLMYIINTRVAIPLAYLPTYGAVAFLPYSLKPIYAYLGSSNSDMNNNCILRPSRQYLFPGLLAANALSLLATTLIPPGGVILAFSLAFGRGITDSWAEFCVGLALIDHARQQSQQQQQQRLQSQRYDKFASRFQSQAATARNLGSFFGSVITCLIFVQRQISLPENKHQLNGTVANALLIATGVLQGTGAVFAICNPSSFRSITSTSSNQNNGTFTLLMQQTEDDHDINNIHGGNGKEEDGRFGRNDYKSGNDTNIDSGDVDSVHPNLGQQQPLRDATESDDSSNAELPLTSSAFVDEESALKDDDCSHPSYSSSNNSQGDQNLLEEPNDFDFIPPMPTTDGAGVSIGDHYYVYSRITNLILVVTLQIVIILIAMRVPFEAWTSSNVAWKILVCTLVIAILFLSLIMYRNRWWQTSHRVGLFLILRHAIPSASMVLASFYYTLFQSAPLQLQLLSLLSQGMITLSSWTYGKILSKYSRGASFLSVIVATTILASLASLCDLAVVGSSSSSSSSSDSNNLFWIAVLIKMVTTFFGEWAFLPDVIVATTSLVTQHHEGYHGHQPVVDEDDHDNVEPIQQSATAAATTISSNTVAHEDDDSRHIAVKYGTMISCIDFGDQLGSMLSGPLVVLLGMTRENDYLHLDRLILISSILGILSLPLVLLLRQKK